MNHTLIVATGVTREKFTMEHFICPDHILALVKSGSFYVENGGTCFTARANEGVLFRKKVPYTRHIVDPARIFLFRFHSENPVFQSDHIRFKDQKRISTTLDMLEALDTKIYKDSFNSKCHLFEDIVLQYTMENNVTPNSDMCIEHAIKKIERSVHHDVNLNAIGKETGLSYVQFLRRFKAFTGLTPSDYITALRLDKAKMLLSNTTLSINEISAACGFENEYYFSNFFKKHLNLSPTAYRKTIV